MISRKGIATKTPGKVAQKSSTMNSEVLESDDVAGPAADEASEDEGEEDGGEEEDEAGVDDAEFEGLHGFGGFDRADGRSGELPLDDACGDDEVDGDEDGGAPFPHPGVRFCFGFPGALRVNDRQADAASGLGFWVKMGHLDGLDRSVGFRSGGEIIGSIHGRLSMFSRVFLRKLRGVPTLGDTAQKARN